MQDWPKIPKVETQYDSTTRNLITSKVDFGILGKWEVGEVHFEESPTDLELAETREMLQEALDNVVLKTAALILIDAEDFCADGMKEWIERALEERAHPV